MFDPESQSKIIKKCVKVIRKSFKDIEYIAVTGLSGLIIGSPVAFLCNKRLIVIRKGTEESHADYDVEGIPNSGADKYIILDDFISSGNTINRIYNEINNPKRVTLSKLKLVGMLFYRSSVSKDNIKRRDILPALTNIPVHEFLV